MKATMNQGTMLLVIMLALYLLFHRYRPSRKRRSRDAEFFRLPSHLECSNPIFLIWYYYGNETFKVLDSRFVGNDFRVTLRRGKLWLVYSSSRYPNVHSVTITFLRQTRGRDGQTKKVEYTFHYAGNDFNMCTTSSTEWLMIQGLRDVDPTLLRYARAVRKRVEKRKDEYWARSGASVGALGQL